MDLTIEEYNYADSGWLEHGVKYFIDFNYSLKTLYEIEKLFGQDFLQYYKILCIKNNGKLSPLNDNLMCFDNEGDCEKTIEELEPYLIMAKLIE